MWLAAAVIAQGTAAAQSGSGKTVYRWTDAQGHVHYGDRLPPDAAGGGHSEIDARGTVRKQVSAQKSAAELAEEEQRAKAAKQQADYDAFLRETYSSVADIEAVRDERLSALNARLAVAKKNLADNEKTLADLHGRTPEGADAQAALDRQIKTFEASRDAAAAAITRLDRDREETAAKYAHDIERFQAIHGPAQ